MPDLKATGHSTHMKSHPTANSTENAIHYKAHFILETTKKGKKWCYLNDDIVSS